MIDSKDLPELKERRQHLLEMIEGITTGYYSNHELVDNTQDTGDDDLGGTRHVSDAMKTVLTELEVYSPDAGGGPVIWWDTGLSKSLSEAEKLKLVRSTLPAGVQDPRYVPAADEPIGVGSEIDLEHMRDQFASLLPLLEDLVAQFDARIKEFETFSQK
ncbi:hypothetical protein [Nesterenkonia alba]|uniref:hypothetical protein n=1 Tax=Nesterenkonia alba TaxID=515814 RepID=UPI0003B3EECA|nr:hypothetical protein [Nesterenkonia alba]